MIEHPSVRPRQSPRRCRQEEGRGAAIAGCETVSRCRCQLRYICGSGFSSVAAASAATCRHRRYGTRHPRPVLSRGRSPITLQTLEKLSAATHNPPHFPSRSPPPGCSYDSLLLFHAAASPVHLLLSLRPGRGSHAASTYGTERSFYCFVIEERLFCPYESPVRRLINLKQQL